MALSKFDKIEIQYRLIIKHFINNLLKADF